MSSILIVTSGPLCRNPRVLKEAGALASAGHAVTVLAPGFAPVYEAWDEALVRGAPFRKLTVGRNGAAGWIGRAATRICRRAARFGLQSRQALGAEFQLARAAGAVPADLTIAHTELGFAVGTRLLRRGRRVAVDFEDWHSRDLLPQAQAERPLKLIRSLESGLLRRVEYASAPSAAMARALHEEYGGARPLVIRNVFPLQSDPRPLRTRRDAGTGALSLLWFSQTIGPGRMLEPFVAAWGQMRVPTRLTLLGEPVPGFMDRLRRLVAADRRDSIQWLPLVAPNALPSAIAAHDLGLALEAPAPESRNLTITNKLFQYLNAGLPFVATDTAGQCEALAEAPGAGILVRATHTGETARELDRLAGDRTRLEAMAHAARKAAEERFCWERESPVLIEAVARALQNASPGERVKVPA